jgi:hypothetical protein
MMAWSTPPAAYLLTVGVEHELDVGSDVDWPCTDELSH